MCYNSAMAGLMKLIFIMLFLAFASAQTEMRFFPEAFAGTDDLEQASVAVCQMHQTATGKAAKAVATIAIIVLGVLATMRRVSWGQACLYSICIVAVFSSITLATYMTGRDRHAADCELTQEPPGTAGDGPVLVEPCEPPTC